MAAEKGRGNTLGLTRISPSRAVAAGDGAVLYDLADARGPVELDRLDPESFLPTLSTWRVSVRDRCLYMAQCDDTANDTLAVEVR